MDNLDPSYTSPRCKQGEKLFLSFRMVDDWKVSKRYFEHIHSCSVCKNARIEEHKEKTWTQPS